MSYYTDIDCIKGYEDMANFDFVENEIEKMIDLYNKAKENKVGSKIACPYCGKESTKATYHKTFCSNKCKDRFWNFMRYRRKLND